MGDAEYVMRTNAIGTLNVNEVFYGTAGEGSAIVNVASMAAHMLPEELIPTAQFPQALQDEDAFMNGHDCRHAASSPRRRDPASPTR